MDEREEGIRHDILLFRQIAELEVTIFDRAMVQMGMSLALIGEKNQAVYLMQFYDAVVASVNHLTDSWREAVALGRDAAAVSAQGNTDFDVRIAADKFLRQTKHLVT